MCIFENPDDEYNEIYEYYRSIYHERYAIKLKLNLFEIYPYYTIYLFYTTRYFIEEDFILYYGMLLVSNRTWNLCILMHT